jgi:hypothetical protein
LVAGFRPFSLVRSPETARSMESPSMGLLRRPTTSEIVEDGRLGRSCGRARIRPHLRKPGCGYAANPAFNCRTSTSQHGWRWSCADAHRPPTCRLGHRNDPPTVRSDASCMASTPRVMPATSFGCWGRLASSMRADKAPNHPIRVRTAHPGWAHAGRYRAGWAKGARS